MQAAATTAAIATDEESSERLLARVQDLQAQIEAAGDPVVVRGLAQELVSAIVELYGSGLRTILDTLFAAGDPGERIAAALAENQLVATLLLIHDLHPVPLSERVHVALEQVRPYMESHGGDVELLSLEHGVARIRLQGTCSSCSASSVTLELAIKQALEALAPDLEGLEVEGVAAVGVEPPTVAPPTAQGSSLPMFADSAPTCIELPIVDSRPPQRLP